MSSGLTALSPALTEIFEQLDACFAAWTPSFGARKMRFSSLLRVADFDRLGSLQNFPHLCFTVSTVRNDCLAALASRASQGMVPADCANDGQFVLATAACYPVYLHLADSMLARSTTIAVVAPCFRNEAAYHGLDRLAEFTLRELICVGSLDAAREHCVRSKRMLLEFAASLGIPVSVEQGQDPFFESARGRAIMQRLSPVKEELVWEGLALASVNFHRNYFGERCNIRMSDGSFAFSSCMGVGLERWVSALLAECQGDESQALSRLERVLDTQRCGVPS